MYIPSLLAALLFSSVLAPARDKAENWIQITSPHFVVATNASEKQGRRIADQFERMRSLFHALFPKLTMDTGTPIIVLAIKDDKDFRALEPEEYLAKGSLKLGGLFLRAADKNYVLMRVDAEGEHPYSVIYHEYTHFLLAKSEEWMPLWMNEGLAEFYQNTDIHETEASLGQPSVENVMWLRQNHLLPLATLFTVDHNSPYYHEENKGSIFYAESWALVHLIETGDFQHQTHRMLDYEELLGKKVDPVTAASQAFGDLKKLQSDLESYVRQASFGYIKMWTVTAVDESAFKAQTLSETHSDALRADFLAYDKRTADSQALLDHVLHEDPTNVSAHETKGFLEFRQGHIEEAKKWYAQAVQLDSQSFLAHYYFAAMTLSVISSEAEQKQAEDSLRTSIKLNSSFAPSYDRLAVYLAALKHNPDEARLTELNAISLDPSNIGYRINMANIYLEMQQPQHAVEVLQTAAKLAKTPADANAVNFALSNAKQFAAMQNESMEKQMADRAAAVTTVVTEKSGFPPPSPHKPFVAKGPHRFVVGVLKSVHCDSAALDLTVNGKDKQVALHGDNYFKIPFTALGFQPTKDLNPCKDLEDRPAKVEYVESADPSATAQLISVELHK
jgi:tetratricopeptide (TPR) repeat protein